MIRPLSGAALLCLLAGASAAPAALAAPPALPGSTDPVASDLRLAQDAIPGTPEAAQPPAAAAKAPGPPPVGRDPSVTTASYGDWTLQCVAVPTTGQRQCGVVQSVQAQGQAAPAAQIVIERLPDAPQAHVVVVTMPANINPATSLTASTGDQDPAPAQLAWRYCVPNGCVAEKTAADDTISTWRAATGPGTIRFAGADGNAVAYPFSLHGLPQALAALAAAPAGKPAGASAEPCQQKSRPGKKAQQEAQATEPGGCEAPADQTPVKRAKTKDEQRKKKEGEGGRRKEESPAH